MPRSSGDTSKKGVSPLRGRRACCWLVRLSQQLLDPESQWLPSMLLAYWLAVSAGYQSGGVAATLGCQYRFEPDEASAALERLAVAPIFVGPMEALTSAVHQIHQAFQLTV
jgi:hypothetical protein